MKSQVIGRHGWFERGKHKNLALRANLENRSAAIADIQVSDAIESDARGNTHTFDPFFGAAFRGNAMNGSIIAA